MKIFTRVVWVVVLVSKISFLNAALPPFVKNETNSVGNPRQELNEALRGEKWREVLELLPQPALTEFDLYTALMAAAGSGITDIVQFFLERKSLFIRIHTAIQFPEERTLMGMLLEAAVTGGSEKIVYIVLSADEIYEEPYRCDLKSLDRARSKARKFGYQVLEQKLGKKFAELTKDWLWA
jgi:hypothetical protein